MIKQGLTGISIMLAIVCGCLGYFYHTSSTELISIQVEVANKDNELNALQMELADTQMELAITREEVADTQMELTNTREELAATRYELTHTQGKLDGIEDMYPLQYFRSYDELVSWVASHKGRDMPTADEQYGEALRIQYEAMLDGYLISVDVDEYGDGCITYLLAVAGGGIYYWFANGTTIYEYSLYYYDMTI